MHKKTPTAPPNDKSSPERESRRQLPLFVDLSFPRRRAVYDSSVLLQVYFDLRSRRIVPKPLAKVRQEQTESDDQLDMFGGASK